MNILRYIKYILATILFLFFLAQAFIFVAFELMAPAFVSEENSTWYNSIFIVSIPLNLYLLYWSTRRLK